MSEHKVLDKPRDPIWQVLASDRGSHSAFSASSSWIWMFCVGGLIPNLMAEDIGGPDAAYGTVGHEVTETWLKSGKRPEHLVGTNVFIEAGDWGHLIAIDDEMLDYAEMCVDWVEFLPGEIFIERRVYYDPITPIPNQGGTADFIAVMPGKLIIADWKFGKGIVVFAKDNPQLMLYALGAFYEFDLDYDFQEIEIRVGQPRLNHFDVWTITRAELLAFAKFAKERAYAAWQLNAPRTPSEKSCAFCKVKDCSAVAKLNVVLIDGQWDNVDSDLESLDEFKTHLSVIDDLNYARISTLTTKELAKLYGFRKMAEKWWKSLANEVYRRATSGEEIPDNKLVHGRSRRVFRSPKVAAKALMDLGLDRSDIFTESMASPNQASELLRGLGYRSAELERVLEPLVARTNGKITLAPITDKRQSVEEGLDSVFENLDDDIPIDAAWLY